MHVADTNVLIYAANADAPEHERCRELLDSWRNAAVPWYTTWPILYEFMRVVTHPRVLPQPLDAGDALRFVEVLLASPSHSMLMESGRHAAIARELVADVPRLAGNLIHDFHTVVLMRENGVGRIYTRDADFRRFPGIEVIDPLA